MTDPEIRTKALECATTLFAVTNWTGYHKFLGILSSFETYIRTGIIPKITKEDHA